MGQSGTFKKQARQARQVVLEDSYAKGMALGDRMLGAGYVRYLVNYTLEDGGTKLAPRQGYQTKFTVEQSLPLVATGYHLFKGADETAPDSSGQYDISNVLYSTNHDNAQILYRVADSDGTDVKVGDCYGARAFATYTHEGEGYLPNVKAWLVSDTFLSYSDDVLCYDVNAGFLKRVTQICITTKDIPTHSYHAADGTVGSYIELDLLHNFRYVAEEPDGIRLLKYSLKSLVPFKIKNNDTYRFAITADTSLKTKMYKGPKDGLYVHDCFKTPFMCRPNILSCTLQNHYIGIGTWENTIVCNSEDEQPDGWHNTITGLYTFDVINEGNAPHIAKENVDWDTVELVAPTQLTPTSVVAAGSNSLGYAYTEKLNVSDYSIALRPYVPYVPDASFAVRYGYNMLLENPYTFNNSVSNTSAWSLYGLLPKDPNTKELKMDYQQGEYIDFELNFACGNIADANTVELVAEYRTLDSDSWNKIPWVATVARNEDTVVITSEDVPVLTLTSGDVLKTWILKMRAPTKDFIVHVNVDNTTEKIILADNTYSFTAGSAGTGTNNIAPKNYTLTDAQGMLSWKQRVVLWGVPDAPNIIFTSDINNPKYFPYPNNIVEYPEPILHAVVFLDSLLVFTTNAIYETALSSDGLSYTTKQVAGDIHLTQADIPAICPVKNMLFYKVGNYYYMLVPSTKYLTLGQLQVAPVSRPINYFLDNFEVELRKLLQMMYGDCLPNRTWTFENSAMCRITPTNYSCFLDGDEVKVNYGFHVVVNYAVSFDFIFCLKYDTLVRAWSVDILELQSQDTLSLYKKNAVGFSEYVVTSNYLKQQRGYVMAITVLKKDPNTCVDVFSGHFLPTRQFLDTGYRELGSVVKKRFREIQLKINNKTDEELSFEAEFYADNERRRKLHDYVIQLDTTTATLVIAPIIQDNPVYGVATLEAPDPDADPAPFSSGLPAEPVDNTKKFWRLSNEYLSSHVLHTLRIKISGKGYSPRMALLSENKTPYEIHGFAWVFRNMNAR